MADSWEDEDFDLPSVAPPTTVPVSWEDEEEEEEPDKSAVAPGTAPKMSAAKAAKTAAEKEARIADGTPAYIFQLMKQLADRCVKHTGNLQVARRNSEAELEKRLQLGETPEERRLRERNRVEEADNELTDDLFGGAGNRKGADGGIANLSLKNMQDHVKLAIELCEKMESSKPAHMAAFLKEMITKLSSKMTTDGMTDVANHITVFRDEKRKTEERIATAKANASNVQAKQRANKKKLAKQKKAHADIFGGEFDGDQIDDVGMEYESKYDDFM